MHNPLVYSLCGTVGPWVKVPKALKEDTPMWVYELGPVFGYESQKTQSNLPLGYSPRIIIIIFTEYLVKH